MAFLLLMETSGNQAFIFSSNRQRDQIGASWLIKRLSTWVDKAVADEPSESGCHIVQISSGKVLMRTKRADAARRIVTATTCLAAGEAPGLVVAGAWIEIDGDSATAGDVARVHHELAAFASTGSLAVARFPMRPFLRPCPDSGLPAAPALDVTEWQRDRDASLSLTSRVKRVHAEPARQDLLDILHRHGVPDGERLVPDLARLEQAYGSGDDTDDTDRLSWVGVIHIDGNGIGKHFRDLQPTAEQTYEDLLGHTAKRLQALTERAYAQASRAVLELARADATCQGLPQPAVVPVIPVILGGDDVTVITDGRHALPFAEAFAREFETDGNGGASGFTVAAGVAIVKVRHPFFHAYELAEELCQNAKSRSRESSTLDYHLLYDSAGADLARVRRESSAPTVKPLEIVGPEGHLDWPTLVARAAAIAGHVDGQAGVPRHQVARIRGLMVTDPGRAAALWQKVCKHPEYGAAARAACGPGHSLIWRAEQGRPAATLLDCIDLIEILPTAYLVDRARPLPDMTPSLAAAVEGNTAAVDVPGASATVTEATRQAHGEAAESRVPAGMHGATRLSLTVDLTGDWSVGQGHGEPGGNDSCVTRDREGRPFVPGTQLTGLFAAAMRQVARSLDAHEPGRTSAWGPWIEGLLGGNGHPALIRIAPALASSNVTTTAQPGVGINPATGTAAHDMKRQIERAGPATLKSSVELLVRGSSGETIQWTSAQQQAAAAVIAVAAGLVRRVGSDRTRGLGAVRVVVDDNPPAIAADVIRRLAGELPPGLPETKPPASGRLPAGSAGQGGLVDAGWSRVRLRFELQQPLLALASRRSNELSGHDYVPGTTVMAWLHRTLQRTWPDDPVVRDAVAHGALLASDASIQAPDGSPGRPVPLSLLASKLEGLEEPCINSLVATSAAVGYQSLSPRVRWLGRDSDGWRALEPVMTVAMHNSIDARTGTTSVGALYSVRAMAPGSVLVADVLVRDDLRTALDAGDRQWWTKVGGTHRLGAKSRTAYGETRVTCGEPIGVQADEPQGDRWLTLVLLSDTIVRTRALGPGRAADLVRHLWDLGVGVSWPTREGPGSGALVSRMGRIDGWHALTSTPHPSRVVIRAGSCLRLRWDGRRKAELAKIALTGIGDRRGEGYGRVALQDPLLAEGTVMIARSR